MSRSNKPPAIAPDRPAETEVEPVRVADTTVKAKAIGGTNSTTFNVTLWRRTSETAYVPHFGKPEIDDRNERDMVEVTADAIKAFAPTDAVEAMIASQAVALHFASIECLKRGMIDKQPSDIASKHRKDGANLARAMVDMVEALGRYRGKEPQVVRVERVVVHEGGQAIVGPVTHGGGDRG